MSAHRNRDQRHAEQALRMMESATPDDLRVGLNALIVASGGRPIRRRQFRADSLRTVIASAIKHASEEAG